MAEWFKAAVLKTVDPKDPGVRIPLPPPLPLISACRLSRIVILIKPYKIIHPRPHGESQRNVNQDRADLVKIDRHIKLIVVMDHQWNYGGKLEKGFPLSDAAGL